VSQRLFFDLTWEKNKKTMKEQSLKMITKPHVQNDLAFQLPEMYN
jgi:hypothetical protein